MQPMPILEQRAKFEDLVCQALDHARALGATDAIAEVSKGQGLSVSVRMGSLETVEQTRGGTLTVTVFAGQRRGSATTSDFSGQAVRQTVEAAWHIARYTAHDDAAGLPDAEDLLQEPALDLSLYHPWDIDVERAVEIALRAENAARELDARIRNTEGATVDTGESQFIMGNTRGFLDGYSSTRHSVSVVPIASQGDAMQRDFWYGSRRQAEHLPSPEEIGVTAASRALARLGARRLSTRQVPVVFEAPLALGLLGGLTQALSGGALYRKASFLQDSLGKQVLADHIMVDEDPFVPGGMGSSMFDGEGVRTRPGPVIQSGEVQHYFLSSYTARKLNMKTTGHAGGSHNLTLRSTRTQSEHDLSWLLREMGTGLLVTELIGQGVNYVTGDYSRGAFGYWVENGEIQYPVEEITIAGNLKDMFMNIAAVGSDTLTRGNKTTGSILIPRMSVAGTSA